jgi:hypothetical protein
MNVAVLVLAIILIVALYFLYKMYADKSSLVEKVDLKLSSPSIDYSTLPSPRTSRYSYGVWIFVNSWSSLEEKNIFSRPSKSGKYDVRLFLDKESPRLKCDILTEGDVKETITLTDNFPVQKWVFVIMSVDNQIVDMYLDGKLVVSKKLAKMPVISESNITLGNSTASASMDIILSKFSRWTSPMDPTSAWSKYMDGNGISSALPSYGMKLTVMKDGVDSKQLKFF